MIKRQLSYLISPAKQGKTVEQFLRQTGYSKRLIIHLRNTPLGILVNGESQRTVRRLLAGDQLSILLEEREDRQILPVPLPFSVIYEDEDLLVVNKDAGVPIHPSQGHHGNTLANAAAYYFSQKKEPFVFRAVNRLDRDTSGLLILARHMLSACILNHMGQRGEICREYLAAADGLVPEQGTITAPIARAPGSTVERCVDLERGEYACTHYRRLCFQPLYGYSLVRLKLDTGRTHQIRVHMRHIGHPLPGDFLYHPDYRHISRQALHSSRLSFCHPLTGTPLNFTAPLPEDIRRLFDT